MLGSTFGGYVDILDVIIRSDRSCRCCRERIAQPLDSFCGEKTKKRPATNIVVSFAIV